MTFRFEIVCVLLILAFVAGYSGFADKLIYELRQCNIDLISK